MTTILLGGRAALPDGKFSPEMKIDFDGGGNSRRTLGTVNVETRVHTPNNLLQIVLGIAATEHIEIGETINELLNLRK